MERCTRQEHREPDAACVGLESIWRSVRTGSTNYVKEIHRNGSSGCTGAVRTRKTGEKYGWGRVLDYIGVGWEDWPSVQMTIFDFPEYLPDDM